MGEKKPLGEVIKAAKFALVGVANTLIDYGVFTLLTQLAGTQLYLANVIAYGCGMLNSYVWNRSWTFRSRERFFSPALLRFVVLNLAMAGLSTVLLYGFHQLLGLSDLIAKGGATLLTLAVNFLCNRLWVFRSQTN